MTNQEWFDNISKIKRKRFGIYEEEEEEEEVAGEEE